jgi:hypothetical protein
MPTSRGEWVLYLLGCAVIGALIALNVLAWQNYSASEQDNVPAPLRTLETQAVSGAAASTERGAPTAEGPSTPERSADNTRSTTRDATANGSPTSAAMPRLADVRLRATTGDCWLEIRADSDSGSILYNGLLVQGQTLHFRRRALWIRVGAPVYLAVTLNGKPAEDFPLTTADALVTARGVETLSLG